MSSLYQDIILDHFKNPRNFGVLPDAGRKVSLYNPLCGDRIEIAVTVANDKILNIKFAGEGCVLSIASASLLTEYAKDKNPKDIQPLTKEFMLSLTGVAVGPTRLKCVLLPLEALQKSITN